MKVRFVASGLLLAIAACGGEGLEAPEGDVESRVVGSLTGARSAVVRIEVEGVLEYPTGSEEEYATGSGFFISHDGYIVTNNHVVAGSDDIKVYVDGESTPLVGALVGASECADIAVIDVEVADQAHLAWASEDPSVGQEMYVAGFPLGDPEYTLIDGIISKQNANGESSWASIDAVVEHTGDTLPGSSGGPILDSNGSVLGVNYAGDDYGQAFGISVEIAQRVVDDILAGSPTQSIGINGWAQKDSRGSGVWVAGVEPDSPAHKAGILPGDLITQLDGLIVGSDSTLSTYCRVLRQKQDDSSIEVQVWRESRGLAYEGALFSDRPMMVGRDQTAAIDRRSPDGTAQGTLTADEEFLIEFIRDWSSEQTYYTVFDFMDDQELLVGAYLVCDALDAGVEPDDLLQIIFQNFEAEQDQFDMTLLMVAAVATLCPEHDPSVD